MMLSASDDPEVSAEFSLADLLAELETQPTPEPDHEQARL